MNESRPGSGADSKVKIEIVKYKWLLNALEDPKLLWRLLISISAMLIMLFFGLSMVAVIVKSMFPYETIKTNPYGATIMEDEKKEVVYWLFNSSELWANSGIRVEKGDVLTIRSSGMMHTAIHHLVNEVEENRQLSEPWVNTDGDRLGQLRDHNKSRAEFRITPNVEQNKLLMKIVDDSGVSAVDKCSYVIGKERTNLVMAEDGVLQFAVNDIAMTDSVICELYEKYMKDVCIKYGLEAEFGAWERFYEQYVKNDLIKYRKPVEIYSDAIKADQDLLEIIECVKKSSDELPGVALGKYFDLPDLYPIVNEVLYYRDADFEEAWFADNVGSFLIVIEKTKKN